MKHKITTIIIGLSIAASTIPMQVFAQYEYTDPSVYDTSVYNYTGVDVSGYNYSAPVVSNYNYTSPSVSEYNYTSPTVSNYNYTSPTVSDYNYTSPSVSNYNYTSPTVSNYDYTSPTYNYTNPSVSDYTYTSPTYTSPTYTSPTYTNPTYTTPTYTAPTYTYPNYTTPSYTTPSYSTPSYSYPTYTQSGNTVTTIPGTNTYICSNGSTPVNGTCNSVITIPGTNTTVCSDGQPMVNGTCNRTTTIPTTVTTRCSDGTYPVNGTCNSVITIPGTNTTVCSDGQPMVNGTCNRTTTVPTTVTTRCSDGSYPVNGSCTITNTIPTTVNTLCSDGLARNYDGSCTRTNVITATQVCSDGSRILATQTCPSPYKVCANGSYVLLNQSCFVPVTPVYVPPTVVKFNNVVTSVVTQITNTSGRCNGIGLIANGAASTGWFEYGETANLGRTTASASIGNSVTAPFSNVLANLKPTTKYYCRAVMQNQYGTVKGEIVSFVTKSKKTTYIATPVTPAKKVTTKKAVTKTNLVTCSDGSTFTAKSIGSESSATILSEGKKLVTLSVEKTEGKLVANGNVSYKVTYKNISDSRLTGVVIKVVLPVEITGVMATTGSFFESTHTLTINQDTVDAYTEGSVTITGKLTSDAPVGKTIITTAYVVYTVPGTNAQDEVTAYVVGSIVPAETIAKLDTGAKKVVGANSDRGFMPSTLVEWLALIAIIAIIFILARSIYISYKDEEGETHGH